MRQSERFPDVPYQPQLIDVTYAGLVGGAASDAPLVIPALNRDGDCLSELVLALYGSIAGAESVLLVLRRGVPDAGRDDRGAARHRPGARGQEHRQPDGDDPGRGRAAALHRARRATRAARPRPRRARSTRRCWRRPRPGIRTPDLGGHATTSEVTDEVVARVRTKLEIWASLSGERLADDAVVRRLHAAGVELAVEATGDPESPAPPLVLAHGLTATRRYVVHGSKLLARSGYRVIAYDARGHGESNPAPDRTAYA